MTAVLAILGALAVVCLVWCCAVAQVALAQRDAARMIREYQEGDR